MKGGLSTLTILYTFFALNNSISVPTLRSNSDGRPGDQVPISLLNKLQWGKRQEKKDMNDIVVESSKSKERMYNFNVKSCLQRYSIGNEWYTTFQLKIFLLGEVIE